MQYFHWLCLWHESVINTKLFTHFYVDTVPWWLLFGRQLQVTVCPMLQDHCSVCLSCLSETLVYCGQTVAWIKMLLGTKVGLGPYDIVLDGDPSPPTERGTAAPPPHTFRPILLWHSRPSQQLLSCWCTLICSLSDLHCADTDTNNCARLLERTIPMKYC